jgi:hypothetical protein
MATMLGSEGSVLLVTILFLLAAGLTSALYAATREPAQRPDEARRSR